MSLEQQINDAIKQTMLAKQTERLTALRAAKAEILLARTAASQADVTDETVLKLLQKMVKQRRETAEVYTQNGRAELAAAELAEAGVLSEFLPAAMSEAELEAAVRGVIAAVGATGPADLGKVMGAASKQLAGRADGRAISEVAKRILK